MPPELNENEAKWRENEPNNEDGNENCVVMRVSDGKVTWDDVNCNDVSYRFICQNGKSNTFCLILVHSDEKRRSYSGLYS